MFSNEENPIKLGRQDRRIHVVNRRDALPKSLDYYKTLWGWLNSGGTERTASYLCALPLSDAEIGEFAGGVSPASDGKTALEDMNVDPGLAVLEDLIRDARNGIGAFAALLTTADQLSDHIGLKVRKPSPRAVSSWLMDMKHQKKGVSPVRIDPKNPNACGVVFAKGVGARLWALTDRDWSAFTSAEILAMWQGKPVPRSASILAFPTKEEEKI
jgi:hypothetical protein